VVKFLSPERGPRDPDRLSPIDYWRMRVNRWAAVLVCGFWTNCAPVAVPATVRASWLLRL